MPPNIKIVGEEEIIKEKYFNCRQSKNCKTCYVYKDFIIKKPRINL